MTLINVLAGYVTVSFIFCMFFVLFIDEETELNLRNVFGLQYEIYEDTKDKLNIAGIIIIEIIVTLVFAGAEALLFFMLAFIWIIETIWKLFCLIFKKR